MQELERRLGTVGVACAGERGLPLTDQLLKLATHLDATGLVGHHKRLDRRVRALAVGARDQEWHVEFDGLRVLGREFGALPRKQRRRGHDALLVVGFEAVQVRLLGQDPLRGAEELGLRVDGVGLTVQRPEQGLVEHLGDATTIHKRACGGTRTGILQVALTQRHALLLLT
ncbi:MAG: hypothetical protein ACK559_04130, partial [bacterium]